jgi:hypothetical protein
MTSNLPAPALRDTCEAHADDGEEISTFTGVARALYEVVRDGPWIVDRGTHYRCAGSPEPSALALLA